MADEQMKVDIGLGIGQVVSVKLSDDELSELRKSVEDGQGWHDLKTQEGSVALNLATVVYIRVADPARGIGFSG
ncbi:MAG TPA: hypothetical protein VD766_04950 [Solirubrobacterales bacterium]|nr:hypothetical protein [Solirubrobacterales bacterium]